jgi:hypothetical protein
LAKAAEKIEEALKREQRETEMREKEKLDKEKHEKDGLEKEKRDDINYGSQHYYQGCWRHIYKNWRGETQRLAPV